MKDNSSRGCYNRYRYATEALANTAKRQRAAEGQQGMRVEHCRHCQGWHLIGRPKHA